MTIDKQGGRSPIFPKKERKTFFFILSLLLLLAANFSTHYHTACCSAGDIFNEQRDLSLLSDEKLSLILNILVGLSLFLSIFCVYKKSYRMLTFIGFILLIAANLSFISGGAFLGLEDILIIVYCAVLLIILAIDGRLSQLGQAKTAKSRSYISYALFTFTFFAFQELIFNLDNYINTAHDCMLFLQQLCAGLSLLILILCIFAMRKKVWTSSPTEEEGSDKSWRSRICNLALSIVKIIILIILWKIASDYTF